MDDVVGYSDISDQCIVMRVEQLIDFIVGEGNRGTTLAVDFGGMLCHVYIFPTSESLRLADIASSITDSGVSGISTKNCMDNVLQLHIIGPVARHLEGACGRCHCF